MASNCIHCTKPAIPVWNKNTHEFVPSINICADCFVTGFYHSYPYVYKDIFEKDKLGFAYSNPSMPELFKNTDIERIPERLRSLLKWKPSDDNRSAGKVSLLLHGASGTCKTRLAWVIFNNLWKDMYPKKCRFFTMRQLESELMTSFKEERHEKVLESLIEIPLLVLDDFGKERMTPRMETDIFSIIDERANRLHTTIITSNYNGQGLTERFINEETGHAVVRRIRDYYEIYSS